MSLEDLSFVWDFFPYCAHDPSFHISYSSLAYYFCVCFFLLFHPCCCHERGGILCILVRSPFPIVHAKWSLVFRSFATSSQWLKTALNFVYKNLYYNKRAVCLFVCLSVRPSHFVTFLYNFNVSWYKFGITVTIL